MAHRSRAKNIRSIMAVAQNGQRAEYQQTITEEDVENFATLTGDANPLHVDAEYAETTSFGRRVAHGALSMGFVSAALARLDGLVIYLGQEVSFSAPVFIGDTVTATAEIVSVEENGMAVVEVRGETENGEVLEGTATVLIRDE